MAPTNLVEFIEAAKIQVGFTQELQRILTKSATTHLASHVIFQRELKKTYAMGAHEIKSNTCSYWKIKPRNFHRNSISLFLNVFPKDKVWLERGHWLVILLTKQYISE